MSWAGYSSPLYSDQIWVDGSLAQTVEKYDPETRDTDPSGYGGVAFPTVEEAIGESKNGDTILIRSGIYREKHTTQEVCYLVDKAITLQPYNGEAVTLTYDPDNLPVPNPLLPDDYGPIIEITAGDVEIDGTKTLTVTGTKSLKATRGDDSDVNIRIADGLSNVTLRRMTIRDAGHAGIKFGDGYGHLIEQNKFINIGASDFDHAIYISVGGSLAQRVTIRHNFFADRRINLYYLDVDYVDVYANIVMDGGDGGILSSGAHNRIYNNTVWGTLTRYALEIYKNGLDASIRNNILLNSANYDIGLDGCDQLPGSDIGNNVYETTLVGSLDPSDFDTWWQDDGTDIQVGPGYDPGFVAADPADWLDFRLAVGSPLIAAGGASPFNELLDPAVTDWPTPKVVTGTLPIGAFASD